MEEILSKAIKYVSTEKTDDSIKKKVKDAFILSISTEPQVTKWRNNEIPHVSKKFILSINVKTLF